MSERLTTAAPGSSQEFMPTQSLRIVIPDDLEFSELRIHRGPDGVSFDWSPIERICEASGIDVALFREQHEDNVAGLLCEWYRQHREAGGEADPIVEDMMAEAAIEDAAGAASVAQAPRKLQ